MEKYITQSGDSFDSIAFKFFGDYRFTEDLMKANPELLNVFIFSAGTEIFIPEVSREAKTKTPPWKK